MENSGPAGNDAFNGSFWEALQATSVRMLNDRSAADLGVLTALSFRPERQGVRTALTRGIQTPAYLVHQLVDRFACSFVVGVKTLTCWP